MKYIRTKDGQLFLNLGETQNGVIVEYNYLGDGLDLVVNYDTIKKQADTIEELCDEFVCLENKMTFHNLETITSSCNLKLAKLETEIRQYKAIEEELGMKLPLFFKIMKAETLCWKDKHKKYTHNIASEFISVKPYWSIGAGIIFEFSWNDRHIDAYTDCDVIIKEQESPIGMPHIYLYLKASEYGKTWALTKEELK